MMGANAGSNAKEGNPITENFWGSTGQTIISSMPLDSLSNLVSFADDLKNGRDNETIQILGEDIFITDYSTTAPPDAKPNENGIMQVEATAAQNIWAAKLGKED